MPSKLCPDCGTETPRKGRCKSCQRAHELEWARVYAKEYTKGLLSNEIQKRRQIRRAKHTIVINEWKNRPCTDCGKEYPPPLMDFDHRLDEIKKFTIAGSKIRSIKQLANEVAKCDVVCCLCHRIRTWNRTHPADSIALTS